MYWPVYPTANVSCVLQMSVARLERLKKIAELSALVRAVTADCQRSLFAWVLILSICVLGRGVAPGEFDSLLRQGRAFHDRADYTHSIPLLQHAVRLAPRSYPANMLLGLDLLRSGKVAEAIFHLQIALSVDPRDSGVTEALAKAYTEAGNFAMAAQILQIKAARATREAKPLQMLAGFSLERFRILSGQLRTTGTGEGVELRVEAASHAEASVSRAALLQEAADHNPAQRGIWGELGVAQLELRKATEVEKSLHEAQGRDPDGADTLQLEALLAAIEGKWPVAESRLLGIGERSPAQLKRVLLKWVPALIPGTEVSGAVWDCMRKSSAVCPLTTGSAAPAVGMSGSGMSEATLFAEGRWEQLAAGPQSVEWSRQQWQWRGVALAETGQCGEAIYPLERGLGTSDDSFGLFWLEICYAGEAEHAGMLLSEAGYKVELYQLRGDVSLQLNQDAARAQEQYAEALKLRPNDPQLLERSAEAMIFLGQTEQARKLVLAALAIDPAMEAALRSLAEMDIGQKDYRAAIEPLTRLAVLHPTDLWPRVELGRAYAQLDNPEEAFRYLGPALASGYPDKKGSLHAVLAKILSRLGRDADAGQAAEEAKRLSNKALESGSMEGTTPLE